MPISLECGLQARPEYRLGDPVIVTATLRNDGKAPIWVLVWNTFLEGMYADFLRITWNGQRLPYDGVLLSRRDPKRASYGHLEPGESLSDVIDISIAYPILEPGDYEAAVDMLLLDAF